MIDAFAEGDSMSGKLAAAVGTALSLLAAACSPTALTGDAAPDYALAQDWVSLPKAPRKAVDVFWVYPTVYDGKPVVAAIDSAQMRQGAEYTLLVQASVFGDDANIFAPLYRQTNLSVVSMDRATRERYFSVGQRDVKKAFAYYLKNLNHGRPFILAGHSQGAEVLSAIVRENLDTPEVREKLVAAYIIGWSITRQDLKEYPFMEICRAAAQTGCIVTYNSVAAGRQAEAPTLLPGAVSVNPLSWSADDGLAPASDNLGSVIFDEKGGQQTFAHFTSARNQDGGLVVAPADPGVLTAMPFGPGIYHVYDYNLFYMNLKANAAQRIKAFQAAGPPGK